MDPVAFICRRKFSTEQQAKIEAGWLFGELAWKPVGTQQRAKIKLLIKSS
jgi:hypothetical protein